MVANDLAAKKVVFVAGHYCSGASIPASEVYAAENIVQISPASTHPDFTDKRPGKGIFRVVSRDDAQGLVAGNYLAKNMPARRSPSSMTGARTEQDWPPRPARR